MTIEELKAYREKCINVQNTIKEDIEYIKKDIKKSEEVRTQNFNDFVRKVQELFQYLPSEQELDSVHNCLKYEDFMRYLGGERVYVFFGRRDYCMSCGEHTFRIFFDGGLGKEGLIIYTDNTLWYRETSCRREQNRNCIYHNREELYNILLEVVADVNKAYNNALIEKNKRLLDRAEELRG